VDSCNLNLGKNIKETLARMPVLVKDPVIEDEHDTIFREGLLLQGDLAALKNAISYNTRAQPAGNLFGSLFANLLQPSNSFGAPAQPSLGMFLKSFH
jgi:hypothetical protein